LGYAYKARLRGLIQATEVAFVPVACPFMGQAGSDRLTPVNYRKRGLIVMMHGGGWMRQLSVADNEKPKITWRLLRRVLTYARPYRWKIIGMLVMILITSGLGLLTPLIMRDLIDRTLPAHDLRRLGLLALGL